MATAKQGATAGIGLDPDALRARYHEEREKRLRPDGIDQYVEVGGAFSRFADDPYAEPFVREPLREEVDVALIGGGFGGLLAGARLRQAGVEDLRVIEKGGDFGGTWYWNRYPGAACDVESYVYLPLLEELGYVPKEKYSRAPEIFDHCKAIARKYDLYRNACLQTEVTEIRWDGTSARWIVATNRNDAIRARFVCLANGFLQRPKLPGIPGIETFRGHAFHTSRWDYAYTGGDSTGNLTGLRGRRVGVIGTGATAIQCIPHVAASAGHLFVFQRTPSSVDVRANRATDPEWAKSLEPGWQQRRMDNFQILTAGGFVEEDLVNDGWTDIVRNLLFVMRSEEDADLSPEGLAAKVEMADFMKMEQIRARVSSIVRNRATAEALKPYYRQFCKRPCFHDEYLETFNRPNVTLVDTNGKGVDRITETGVVVEGREYELDCLIYATGFEVGTDYSRRAGYELIGSRGLTLTEKWRDGVTTMHGLHIRGFPNCFMMSIAQSGLTVNFPYMIDQQAKHVAYIVQRALGEGIRTLEASAEAEAEWVATILCLAEGKASFGEQCTPGYYNNEGRPDPKSRQSLFFMGGPMEFVEILESWRQDGRMQGLELSFGDRAPSQEGVMAQSTFDPSRYKWRKVTGEPQLSCKIRHDYTILGYDLNAGTLDMVVRWAGDGGHCPIHRHVATTTVLVLEGEQHLWDLHPDGTRGPERVRRAGDYALTVGEALPHLERGGPEGGMVFFGNHSTDGLLYDLLDDDLKVIAQVTMAGLVDDWKANT